MAEHGDKKPSAQKAEGKLKKMIKNTLVWASIVQGWGLGFGEQAPRPACSNARLKPSPAA